MYPQSVLFFLALLPVSSSFFIIPPSFSIANDARIITKLNLIREQYEAQVVTESEVVNDESNGLLLSRRSLWNRSITTLAGAYTLSTIPPSNAAESTATATRMEQYNDVEYGFHFSVPTTWEITEQKLSGRRKALFATDLTSKDADTGTIETFGFVAYTPVRDDFTSLASFGSVDNVAQMTILPKGDLAGQGDESTMLTAVSKNNAYYFDYIATPVVPIEDGTPSSGALTKKLKAQHFRTIFTLLPLKNSAGMTLVTLTLQTSEEKYATLRGLFDQIIDSFGKN